MSALAAVTLATGLALVTQDAAVLRAAPNDQAPTQAQLWPGDALEVRGERLGWLQVWDPRRERPGFVRVQQVHAVGGSAQSANDLLAVLRFVRDTPGAESLGVGVAAAYLNKVPADQQQAEAWDALGQMAERLAQRASARPQVVQAQAGLGGTPSATADARLAGHLEAVQAYGVKFVGLERDGQVQLCYDAQAYGQVLRHATATPAQKARALLGLTRPDCVPPEALGTQATATWQRQAAWLDGLPPTEWAALSEQHRNQLRMRRAGVWSRLAHEQARQGHSALAAGQRAVQELAAVQPTELTDDDRVSYNDAAIRVGASRWAAVPAVSDWAPTAQRPGLSLHTEASGETCVQLVDARQGPERPLLRRCTWGVAWLNSARFHPKGDVVVLAVQPLPEWRELWVMQRTPDGWRLQVLPPASAQSMAQDRGVVEWAGWWAQSPELLVARESRVQGRYLRRFERVGLDDLATVQQAARPEDLPGFKRWADAAWKGTTVMLR